MPAPPIDSRLHLARSLAVTLAAGPWTPDAVQAALTRRLPVGLARLAPGLATGLMARLPASYAPAPDRIARAMLEVPAFGRLWTHVARHSVWPDPVLSPPPMQPHPAFARLDLPRIVTTAELADWLAVTVGRLDYLSDPTARHERHGETAVNHYFYHLRPKPTGGLRLIEAPKPGLKGLQRRVLTGILDQVPAHPDAFGFVRGRDCRQAVARHAGEALVHCFDLRDFFPSVGFARVLGLFRCLGYPLPVAHALAGLCTNAVPPRLLDRLPADRRAIFRGVHLPQGAPSSPSLANLTAYRLDCRLSALAASLGAAYSRYADDLTFSGEAPVRAALLRLVPAIVTEEGFGLHPLKTRVQPAHLRQTVTGIVVNHAPNLTRDHYDRLKAAVHRWTLGRGDPAELSALVGRIGWLERVNPPKGAKLRLRLSAALAGASGPSAFP